MTKKQTRRAKSFADELVKKAREAMLTAVQIFNNPQIEFKSELFIVTNTIAWTYLLHAYYRKRRTEYRTRRPGKRFERTRHGAVHHWSLEQCLDCDQCPIDDITTKNLKFLLGIRHEIEHQMTRRLDDPLSGKFQSAALNFNTAIKRHFGKRYSLDAEQAFSIQFSGLSEESAKDLMVHADLPQNIQTYIVQYESGLTQEEYDDPRFSYRVAFVRKTSNSKAAADKVVAFIPPGTDTAVEINKVFLKETEKQKYGATTIVKQMRAEGFARFNIASHTDLWRSRDAKNPKYQYGTPVEKAWYWYEGWVTEVRKHCMENAAKYQETPRSRRLPRQAGKPRELRDSCGPSRSLMGRSEGVRAPMLVSDRQRFRPPFAISRYFVISSGDEERTHAAFRSAPHRASVGSRSPRRRDWPSQAALDKRAACRSVDAERQPRLAGPRRGDPERRRTRRGSPDSRGGRGPSQAPR
jgi:hypothetical protein